MFPGSHSVNLSSNRKTTTEQYLAWALAALVVLFCLSARLSRYEGLRRNLKPATEQVNPLSTATMLGTALIGVLLLWGLGPANGPRMKVATPSPVSATPDSRRSRGGFEHEFHVRPPPRG